jgi:N-acetylmuramic acid 6-phosphate etherase
MERITELPSNYRHLEQMSVSELLYNMNKEDQTVPQAVARSISQMEPLIAAIVDKMKNGGRLFYIGAGTSGRLGVLDASEIPPTFGVGEEMIMGLIAGGDYAIRHAVEDAEDNTRQAWKDLAVFNIDQQDVVIGIAASGTTPYVIGGLEDCRANGLVTGCITCNPNSPLAAAADFPVEIVTGPEFVTGSTRMKAGTAQKLALNMISTSVMIQMGRVLDNKMVDMQLTNDKLVDRGVKMLVSNLDIHYDEAKKWLLKYGSVRKAMDAYQNEQNLVKS